MEEFLMVLQIINEVIPIVEKVTNAIGKRKKLRAQQSQQLSIALDEFWSVTDNLSQSDRQALRKFIETNNEPVEFSSATWHSPTSIFSSQWVNKSEMRMNKAKLDELKGQAFNPINTISIYSTTQYNLKPEIYLFTKYSLERTGKICHFE